MVSLRFGSLRTSVVGALRLRIDLIARVRTEYAFNPIRIVGVIADDHFKLSTTRCDANDDVPVQALELRYELIVDDLVCRHHVGRKDITVTWIESFAQHSANRHDAWVCHIPCRDNKDTRAKGTDKIRSERVKVRVVVRDSYFNRTRSSGHRRFNVSPRLFSLLGVASQVAPREVVKLS